jgi:DNA-binding PadR family transcriptional regulator
LTPWRLRANVFRVNIFRGNIKPGDFGALTPMEFEILLSLAGGDLHGYAIIQDIGERSGGTLTARPGTLYRAISRLLDAGLIQEVAGAHGDDERRRYYSMTRAGRQVAAVETQRLERQLATARARKLIRTKA